MSTLKKSKIMLADGFPTLPDFDAMETGEATKDDVYATQDIIAHVQKTLKADKAYTSGESFIYNGVLYNTTTSIAKDATIVLTGVGANATAASVIQTQINDCLKDDYNNIKVTATNYSNYISNLHSSLSITGSDRFTITRNSNILEIRARLSVNADINADSMIHAFTFNAATTGITQSLVDNQPSKFTLLVGDYDTIYGDARLAKVSGGNVEVQFYAAKKIPVSASEPINFGLIYII